jgi:cystathionine gamma-lyase
MGPSTRTIHAGVPEGAQGEPLRPGPVLAAPYHLRGDADSAPYGYGRDGNPSWTHLERALGVETRLVPTDTDAILAAVEGAALVFVETPSNPRLDVCDLAAVAEAAHAAGALLAVDNTVCTPLGQQPLALGADLAMLSGTKSLCGHSDVLLGAVTARDPERAAALGEWRSQSGAIPGGSDAWLAHRSIATLGLRLERSSANAAALAALLEARNDVLEVMHPRGALAERQMAFTGPLVGFTLASAAHAQAFLDACELVAEATSFGGVHSTAERRARWGTDDVAPGFIRFSAGCEDTADLIADVEQALGR